MAGTKGDHSVKVKPDQNQENEEINITNLGFKTEDGKLILHQLNIDNSPRSVWRQSSPRNIGLKFHFNNLFKNETKNIPLNDVMMVLSKNVKWTIQIVDSDVIALTDLSINLADLHKNDKSSQTELSPQFYFFKFY